ncbi:uncharacterized protein LOC126375640 isoform X2 [Pectinophora gossypiella]|uniref:uncharacterized protein LOC126375640 isoform X2 n=1 Tax=Pectinophora gossypiella TaxID=13191 RepID=UPI00214F4111|nr:uncharacterized protein LOC126375640 isoform X2 [Pectinophora gossypiella]
MNQFDHNINKDMSDSDLIDVESLDFSDEQTWLYKVPEDSGAKIDIVDWSLSLDWPVYEDEEYDNTEKQLYAVLDEILKKQVLAMPDKHKFDSRTYVKPKKRVQRPSIHNIVEGSSNPPSISPNNSLITSGNKYLTYNKYTSPLGPIGPMLRLKTFNVDTNTENSTAVKEYAMKRRSLVSDDDPQLEDIDMTLVSEGSERLSEPTMTRPINIDLSQPAHNLHNTFNKGMMISDRGSLNMYQSGESLMRMSPPSLVSSLLMEHSGTFNPESLEGRKSLTVHRDSGVTSGRESLDPMMTSMTLSILDEKDMSTSFLSQTTYPDNDSLMDSLPPSLVSSVNSSYVVSNTTPKPRSDSVDSNNIFSSATFTHLEQSEKLLSARPRHQMYNSFKRETPMRNSESYTKAREEACQIDSAKILNENIDKKEAKVSKPNEMAETITLHYSNNKFRRNIDAEKENVNSSFEKDDAFYKDMGMPGKPIDVARNSLNVTLDKQELNEIIQARQKLSLARKALPNEPERSLPNQVEVSPTKTFISTNQPMAVPRKSMDNASELLSRRRAYANGYDKQEEPVREPPKRNATFKKTSPRASMDTTVVFVKDDNPIIDINSATLNLIDASERTLQQEEWSSQERAMVGSSESTDTATFSSSSPPDSVPDTAANDPRAHVASTPLTVRKCGKTDLLNLHTTISPIYNMVDDKSYTVTKAPIANSSGGIDINNTTVINSATMVKKSAKRDIMKTSPEKKIAPPAQVKSPPAKVPNTASYSVMAPPAGMVRKTSLPTSKLRQYSSHKELRLPVSSSNSSNCPSTSSTRQSTGRNMVRRNVYASNPALSPTASAPVRRDSYTIAVEHPPLRDEEVSAKPVLTNPPVLVRQGTETLRRERPQSQLVQPKDPPTTRPYSIAGATQLRITRPASGPAQKPAPVATQAEQRPASGSDARVSALPRPSRLPGPRRTLRPPSVYSVAPTADVDHY